MRHNDESNVWRYEKASFKFVHSGVLFKRHLDRHRVGAIILSPKAKMIALVKVFCSLTSWRVALKSLFKPVKLGSVLFSFSWSTIATRRGRFLP